MKSVARGFLLPLLALGCRLQPLVLAPPAAAPAQPESTGIFRAGFGRADITPPAGVGLAGNGPEGKRANGYRHRLYARTLVLDDGHGERVAFVVADLPFISALLQRRAAAALEPASGIGVDRLMLMATHTHAAPGHFLESAQLNTEGSRVPGYDPEIVDSLATRIARAVSQAAQSLRPARAAWGEAPVWGYTRNRSLDAFLRNAPRPWPFAEPPASLTPEERAVNPRFAMLRVDLSADRFPGDDAFLPAGAFSVFAMHGTGNAPENDLLDGDIHALVERGVERHIDGAAAGAEPFRPRAVHLFANGTEGDVSPDWPANARCDLPRLEPVVRPGGPRKRPAWDWQHPPAAHVAQCLRAARTYVNAAGDSLAARANALFDGLAVHLQDHLTIAVAFRTLALRRDAARLGLCDRPMIGTSTAGGAEDGRTRFYRFRFLGLIDAGLEEGGKSVRRNPSGCQREKNTMLNHFIVAHALPEYGQLAVVRVGGMWLGLVPAEVTTMAGVEMAAAIADSAALEGTERDSVLIISHSNGFLQYVTTDQEYTAQSYEGGSTLYGPNEALVLAAALGGLGAALRRAAPASPPNLIDPIIAYPGPATSVVRRVAPPDPARFRRVVEPPLRCADTLVVRFVDVHPSQLPLGAGPILRIEHSTEGEWRRLAWDDDRYLEVRSLERRHEGAWLWEVRWAVHGVPGPYRLVLEPRGDLAEVAGPACTPAGPAVSR